MHVLKNNNFKAFFSIMKGIIMCRVFGNCGEVRGEISRISSIKCNQ